MSPQHTATPQRCCGIYIAPRSRTVGAVCPSWGSRALGRRQVVLATRRDHGSAETSGASASETAVEIATGDAGQQICLLLPEAGDDSKLSVQLGYHRSLSPLSDEEPAARRADGDMCDARPRAPCVLRWKTHFRKTAFPDLNSRREDENRWRTSGHPGGHCGQLPEGWSTSVATPRISCLVTGRAAVERRRDRHRGCGTADRLASAREPAE